MAFTKVVRGDEEATERYSAWDRAMANWNRLYYCTRDDVVFDPQTGKVVPEEALQEMLAMDVENQRQIAQGSASVARK